MAKITQVTIINNSTIRLDQDCKAGDEINLLEISKVDPTFIKQRIDQNINDEIKKLLKENEEKLKKENQVAQDLALSKQENKFNEQINTLTQEINKLRQEKDNFEANKKAEIDKAISDTKLENSKEVQKLELEKKEAVNELTQEINKLRQEKDNFEANKKAEIDKAISDTKLENSKEVQKLELEKQKLENEKNNLTSENVKALESLKDKLELEKVSELNELKKQIELLNNDISTKEKQISDLTYSKSMLNVKKIGEQLENWCNTEFDNYKQCGGFANCTWEKDNKTAKNEDDENDKPTKADYIFRVYADNELKVELTSVACEMKNESPSSTNKHNNKQFFKKLNDDRTKKKCEYALLISELEMEQFNDLPIRKISEYDKMYMVRPQYFINFLTVIYSLSLKYKEMILENEKEKENVKDIETIKNEFASIKSKLFEKPLQNLEKNLVEILKNSESIQKASASITNAASSLINDTLAKMKIEIDNYDIVTSKVGKKVKKLED